MRQAVSRLVGSSSRHITRRLRRLQPSSGLSECTSRRYHVKPNDHHQLKLPNKPLISLILKGTCDQQPNESHEAYSARSFGDLYKMLPNAWHHKTLLCLKVKQTVLDPNAELLKPDNKINKAAVMYTGHVIAGMFQVTPAHLVPIDHTWVSWTSEGFESQSTILKNFMTRKQSWDRMHRKGSSEYLSLTPLSYLSITQKEYSSVLIKCNSHIPCTIYKRMPVVRPFIIS